MEKTNVAQSILSNSVIYCTALYLAAQNGHRDVVKYISELPIVPATDGIFQFTSVYLAAQKGNLDIFKTTFENVIALRTECEDVCEIANDHNEDGQANEVDAGEGTSQNVVSDQIEDVIVCSTIFEAAQIGELSQIKSFIDQGIDVNVKDGNGFAPLHRAAQAGRAECVKLLIEYGANIEENDTSSNTALHLACENGHSDVALLLINKGANVDAEGCRKRTPLYFAAKFGSETIVPLLLNKGANMNALDYSGYPILSEVHNKNILNIFLEKGYNYKRVISSGTILHAAAAYDNVDLADFIFEKQIYVKEQVRLEEEARVAKEEQMKKEREEKERVEKEEVERKYKLIQQMYELSAAKQRQREEELEKRLTQEKEALWRGGREKVPDIWRRGETKKLDDSSREPPARYYTSRRGEPKPPGAAGAPEEVPERKKEDVWKPTRVRSGPPLPPTTDREKRYGGGFWRSGSPKYITSALLRREWGIGGGGGGGRAGGREGGSDWRTAKESKRDDFSRLDDKKDERRDDKDARDDRRGGDRRDDREREERRRPAARAPEKARDSPQDDPEGWSQVRRR